MPGSIKVVAANNNTGTDKHESALSSGTKRVSAHHKNKPSLRALNVECEDTVNPLGSARGSLLHGGSGSFRGLPQAATSGHEDPFKTSGGAHDSDSDDENGIYGGSIPILPIDHQPLPQMNEENRTAQTGEI